MSRVLTAALEEESRPIESELFALNNLSHQASLVPIWQIGSAFQKDYLPEGGMLDIMAGISGRHVMFPGPSPLLRGRYYPVAAAVKLVVTDLLEGSIEEFLRARASVAANSLDDALSSRKVRVNIKKGADGIGQLTEYQGQTKNCIRADFVVMFIEIVNDGRESTEADIIYFNLLPNSPLRCHPVMIANADENDSHDLSISLG